MKSSRRLVLLAALSVLCFPTLAQYRETETRLTESAAIDAETSDFWGLDQTEWLRYQELKSGVRAHLSIDTISPLEVLGIHAKSEFERKKYAHQWARVVYEDAKRVLEFQRAFDDAMHAITQDEPLIDIVHLPHGTSKTQTLEGSDRLILFVETDCAICSNLVPSILDAIPTNVPLDIFFLESTAVLDSRRVDSWLMEYGLVEHVNSNRNVTFNNDGGLLSKLFPRAKRIPILISIEKEQLKLIDLARFL